MSNEKVEGENLNLPAIFSPKFLSFFGNTKSLKLFSTTHIECTRFYYYFLGAFHVDTTTLSLSVVCVCVCVQRLYKSEETLFLS